MSVKIRLQRYGRKKAAYYHIVVADARAPRDGKFIELIGNYNPNTNPARIELQLDKAVSWLEKGAQPTETARAILSYKGALHKLHLKKGVVKGALTEEQVETKFNQWLEQKTAQIEAKKAKLAGEKDSSFQERMKREAKVRADIAKKVAAKNTPPAEEAAPEAEAENSDVNAETSADTTSESTEETQA